LSETYPWRGGRRKVMTENSEEETLNALTSVKKSMDVFNKSLSESLRKLEEGIFRISSLGEAHIMLIVTLMDVLGVPEDQRPQLTFPSAPIEAVSSAERSEAIVSGILRIVIKSLSKRCGDISKALIASKEQINVTIGNFDTYEMEVLAGMLTKDPQRYLDSDEIVAYREKIKRWHQQLKEAFERP
jgi:hypothetical protein